MQLARFNKTKSQIKLWKIIKKFTLYLMKYLILLSEVWN